MFVKKYDLKGREIIVEHKYAITYKFPEPSSGLYSKHTAYADTKKEYERLLNKCKENKCVIVMVEGVR